MGGFPANGSGSVLSTIRNHVLNASVSWSTGGSGVAFVSRRLTEKGRGKRDAAEQKKNQKNGKRRLLSQQLQISVLNSCLVAFLNVSDFVYPVFSLDVRSLKSLETSTGCDSPLLSSQEEHEGSVGI